MNDAQKILENMVGPLTIGKLIRNYRRRNDITLEVLAIKLNVTKGFISNIETGKKSISLEKCLEIAKSLKHSKEFFANVWFQEQARNAGLDWKKITKKIA
jgi:transcriptional regulator with XRE-family HTH domain